MSFNIMTTREQPAATAKPLKRPPDPATPSGPKTQAEIEADQAAFFVLNAGKRPYLNHETEVSK